MKSKPAPRRDRPAPPRGVAGAAAHLPQPGHPRKYDLLYLLGIVLVGFAIYWRSLWGPFLFDDADLLEARSAVRLKDWYVILTGPRPLLIFSYALNHWLSDGFQPFSFRLISLALHITNTVILWRIARSIAASPGLATWLQPGARNLVAFFVPLLFLASPVQTESVAYISSRSELMAATFYLLGLWVFVSPWREQRPWIASLLIVIFYACAVSSKQHAITLPVAILLADYFFLAAGDWRQLKKRWPVYTVFGTLMVVGAFIVVRNIINVPSAGFFLKEVTWKDYLFTQFRMYFLYLRLLLVPFGLNADYDIQLSRSLFEHGSWLALPGIILLVGAAIYFRRRFALAAFGLLFFFLALAPTSSFYPLIDYAAERRLYLPSIGFFLAALALAGEWRRSRHVLFPVLAAVLVTYSVGAMARNRVWQDSLALWEDTAKKSPRKWRVHTWLGIEYSRRQRFAEAAGAYQRAAELVPQNTSEHAEVLSSLGSTFNNRRLYAEAIQYYQAAIKISPASATLWTNLAIAELRLGRPEGWKHFEKAIEVNPLAWEPHFARGNMYYQLGLYDEAIKDYERVLNLVPDHGDARQNLRAAQTMKRKIASIKPQQTPQRP